MQYNTKYEDNIQFLKQKQGNRYSTVTTTRTALLAFSNDGDFVSFLLCSHGPVALLPPWYAWQGAAVLLGSVGLACPQLVR